MKYLFILGRNPELSIAEIFSYLKKEENEVLDFVRIKNAILVELKESLDGGAIDFLGGTIAIGKVLCLANENELEKQTIYYGTENKMNYCIWNFSFDNSYNKISDYLKKRFRAEKLKASEKPLGGNLDLQGGKMVKISSGLIDEEYFIFDKFFGKIIEKVNYKKLEERDMKKPIRRQELSISPRLAKIMINLSEVKEGETLVDPFCGIGAVLVEALLQDVKVIGIDVDENAIAGAKKNLEWANFSKEKYKLVVGDSARVNFFRGDALVTEPDLGAILKKTVSEKIAKEMLGKFENLIIKVLKNFKNKIRGRIVFSAPYILLFNKKRASCNINLICERTGLKLVTGGFGEFRKDQIVGRQIFVLEKI